jgi:hypothetical protein
MGPMMPLVVRGMSLGAPCRRPPHSPSEPLEIAMATIRKLRGRWQARVRRRGMKPGAKSFDSKSEAERWTRDLEGQVDKFGSTHDTRFLGSTTLADLLRGYQLEVTSTKRGCVPESQGIKVLLRHDLPHRTLVGWLSAADTAGFRDERFGPSPAGHGAA